MSIFEPFHASIINSVNDLDPRDKDFVVKLKTYADLVRVTKVPKEYRAIVIEVFAREAAKLRRMNLGPVGLAIYACDDVAAAMSQQNEEDAAREQQKQQ